VDHLGGVSSVRRNTRGSIEVGKFADLVVIDRDYLSCTEDEIRRIEPVATIVNGRVVAGRL